MSRVLIRRMLWIPGLFAVAALASPGVVAGGCYTVVVPADLVLPDGSLHPAGPLQLCFERQLNPVAEMQKISVGGMAQGFYVGSMHVTEGVVKQPTVVFHRNHNKEMILTGFIRPGSGRGEPATSIRLAEPARVRELAERGLLDRPAAGARATRGLPRNSAPNGMPTGGTVMLLAAR